MKTFLLLTAAHGFLWLVLLFALCFLLVHTVYLAQLGRKYQKEKSKKTNATAPQKTEKTAPPTKSEEPIYYIVERKRRAKSSYSEPKRIHFK